MSKPNWVVSQAVVVLPPLHIKGIGVGAKRMLRSSIELFILVFSVPIFTHCSSPASQWSRSRYQFWKAHRILEPTKLPPTPASTSTSTPTHAPTRPSYWRFWSQTPTFLAAYSSSSLASCGLSSWDMEVWVTWLTWSVSCRHEWCMLVATLIRRREVSMASLYLYMSDSSPQADYCTWDGKWKILLCVLMVSSRGWIWLWSAPRKT